VPFPEEIDFHNTTYVGDEPESARLALYRAEEHRKAERHLDAGREVLKLLRGSTRGPVRMSERLVAPVETAAALFLLGLPEEARAALAREESELEPPLPEDPDPAALRAFAARHPLSARAEEAWLRAGTLELLSGDPGSAAADLERIVHWPLAPPSAADGASSVRALAAARLLEAQARLGEAPVEGPLAAWPLAAAVTERGEARRSVADLVLAARSGAAPGRDSTTLLCDDSRSARPQFPDAQPQPAFVLRRFAPNDLVQEPEYALHRRRFLLPTELRSEPGRAEVELELKDLPFRAPLLLGERLVTIEPAAPDDGAPVAIHVRGLADGKELFEPIRSDFDLHLDPRKFRVALDRAALAARGDALYVTLELRDARRPLFEFARTPGASGTALFRLDLSREGFVEVGVTGEELAADPELDGFVLAGPAVEHAGRALVAASRLVGKETECALLAFDARTGAPAGKLLLARASAIPRVGDRFVEDETRRVNPSPIALRDGTAYVCTNLGVIAAVRARDLELQWSFRYRRIDPAEADRFARHVFFDVGPWIGRAPAALADRVLASPSDSLYLYSLARWPDREGHLLLNDPIEKQARVCWLGADEKRCWFLRRRGQPGGVVGSVEATDHDGAPLWQMDVLGGPVSGAPALSSRFLFVPTDRCIYRFDLEAEGLCGAIPPPSELGVPYPEFGAFGDLAVAEGILVSASQLCTIVLRTPRE
jgi:hypothetical protein